MLPTMKKDNHYLGLPLFWGRDKTKHFQVVKDRIHSKLVGWKSKALSQAGRTTLIKFVATSIPQYFTQSLQFPAGWCFQVDKLLKDFWWGFSPTKKCNYTPKAWMSICQPKPMGGGIRCMEDINFAFLQKLAGIFLRN
ncbi:hypothetical protein CJ030_MR4G021252 [Morella rubra]|uniref:Uncharacterized protein n=1 Tax=Morella rubra TaxID=262757 RepID=A0A6A1VVW6_9ROSI|nr:hypothetical protein CJ030_MR4G021252 [Morella rubra]